MGFLAMLSEILKAAFLGLIEGVAEFLPISTTAHLLLAQSLLNDGLSLDVSFSVVVQMGAALAVCWHFRKRFFALSFAFLSLRGRSEDKKLCIQLGLGLLPIVILGFLFHDFITAQLFSVQWIAWALIIGGLGILLVENRYARKLRATGFEAPAHMVPTQIEVISEFSTGPHSPLAEHPEALGSVRQSPSAHSSAAHSPTQAWAQNLSLRAAFGIGCIQVLALIPGSSRAASSIMGGLLLGLNRAAAVEFSFLMAAPLLLGTSFYHLLQAPEVLSQTNELRTLSIAILVAFVMALLSIRLLLSWIARHSFAPFGWYRIALGIGMLWWL